MALRINRPTYFLSLLWLGCLAACAFTVWLSLQQPWLGVRLAVVDEKVLVAVDYSQQIPEGAELKRLVSTTGTTIDLNVSDMVENTDYFPSYAKKDEFFARQSAINMMLHEGMVSMVWSANEAAEHTSVIKPSQRPLVSLSAMFWFQLAVVSTSFMIACWVWLMRPQDWGARMFVLTGLSLLLGGITGVLMSERGLALDGAWFSKLDIVNSLSAHLFGISILALILSYPRQLVAPRTLLWLPVLAIPGWLAYSFHIFPSPSETSFAIVFLVLLTLVFGGVQWKFTRGLPLERAALRWFLMSVLLGSILFTLSNVVPLIFDKPPLLPVGYSIGFFLIMYVGIALGMRRYRLFDMDEWAYRLILWVLGATSVIVLDGLFIFFGLAEGTSLGVSLLVAGWLYFPLRQWLWKLIVNKHFPKFESLLPELSAIAFTASHSEQKFRWESFLMRVYDPLEMKQGDADIKDARVLEEGLALQVPASATLPSYTLRYADRGIRLFSTRDADFAMALSQLLHQVMGGRTSYEQGVAQERLRIGRDLHDNIGARLLKLIHHLRGTPDADIARDAMKDLRTSIAAMDSQPVPLQDALADWRAEASSRCEVARCQLHWNQLQDIPNVDLPPRMKGMLESVMREVITNALKHASPQSIQVSVEVSETKMKVDVENDGDIADPLTWQDGYGLRNMRGRMEELGGNLNISSCNDKVQLTLTVPLQ